MNWLRWLPIVPICNCGNLSNNESRTDGESFRSCLGQSAASTASEIVVFVTRQDLYKKRAKFVLDFEEGNIRRNSPKERQEKRIRDRKLYYGKLMPFIYARFFGLLGLFRVILARTISLVPPYDAGSFGMRYACDGK